MTDENHLLRLINKHTRHDVLNNLATIRSILEVYQDKKDEDLLNKVYNQIERSVEFLNRMKEVESLLPDSSLKFLRVSEALEGVIDKHGVECNVRGDCEVIADAALSAVFDNLIENAVAHGGADRVDIDIHDRGKTCQIEVADNGQGIPEDIKDSIFEEGFSGGRGTGLGLYIIKKTIERYGGTIHVKDNSQTSHGTTFVLTLYTQFGLNDSELNTTDQKWAEKRLRESEEKYRNFFQTSRDAVFITSKEGNWIDINDATVELFGYESKEELMKVKVPHIYADPADREEHIRAIEQRGFIEEYPVNLRRKDGSVINTLITSVPVRDESGNVIGFQGTIHDVTEHRQMEESYRALVESAGDNIYVLDNDMRFLHANTKYLERIGATLDGIVGKHYGDLHPKKGTKRFQERVNEVREQREPLTYEYRSDRDGRYFLRTLSPQINRETGEIDGITVISKDITEQKEVEERLRESEEKYRSLFENSPVVVWEEDFSSFKDYVDDLKERVEDLETYLEENPEEIMKCFKMIDIIDVNRAALDYYGARTKEELIQNLDNLVCEETYGSLKNEIIAIAEGKTYYRMETVAKTLDGKERDELLELRVPEEYQDDFSRVYVTAIDITERKLTERKLQESEEKYRTLYEYLKRLYTLLETISDINELVAKEKNPGRVMNAVCSKLRNLYKAVFTSLMESGELEPVRSEGIDMQSLKKTINQCPSITRAMEGELMKVATDSDLCKHCTKEQHNYALSIPLTHEKQHGVITIHSLSDFSEEEITLLQKLASNVGFALFAYEVEESEKRAIEQLQNNFRQFEKTADRLRNPLAIILSLLELTDYYKEKEILKIVNEQAERIKEELDNLRREEMQTFELVEKFREHKE